MNTEDYKPLSPLPQWYDIFAMQEELKYKYEPEARELFQNFDLDYYEDQELFKKYCWRITEEISEAVEATTISPSKEHVEEELIDALNFTIELMLLSRQPLDMLTYNPDLKVRALGSPSRIAGEVITSLGLVANLLKNRQWRRSQYLVDMYIFEKRFRDFAQLFYTILLIVFKSDEHIREVWSLKYQVNLFRIETNY